VITSLVIWLLYMLHLGLLDLAILILPFEILSDNRAVIVRKLQPIVLWSNLVLYFATQAVIWDVSPTVNDALELIATAGFEMGGINLSPGFFVTVGLVFYGALLCSKGIQAVLLLKVLPRYGAEKGVQLSIARLVHYAILTVGFIVMLKILGFELNQLTILGGALGVGIGFGLQAIVNNFASGLILLFERPIKVGDTIQIGSDLGEVKNMGLRATVIQTFDNAEIVVPNSDLITGQVTNWTLAERRARIRVTVGVAYGSEVSKVLEVLKGCANENPMVLNSPEPSAFFLAFGASSLDFELRVWIPEYLNKTQVLSDLNQDIENEFALNEIEVPFPQTDLHLRSVDELAGERLRAGVKGELTTSAPT
jgi:potassium efflux system protein